MSPECPPDVIGRQPLDYPTSDDLDQYDVEVCASPKAHSNMTQDPTPTPCHADPPDVIGRQPLDYLASDELDQYDAEVCSSPKARSDLTQGPTKPPCHADYPVVRPSFFSCGCAYVLLCILLLSFDFWWNTDTWHERLGYAGVLYTVGVIISLAFASLGIAALKRHSPRDRPIISGIWTCPIACCKTSGCAQRFGYHILLWILFIGYTLIIKFSSVNAMFAIIQGVQQLAGGNASIFNCEDPDESFTPQMYAAWLLVSLADTVRGALALWFLCLYKKALEEQDMFDLAETSKLADAAC